MTVTDGRPVVPVSTVTTSHPTPCPAWCKDRHAPLRHHFGPTSTAHWSPQYRLANPAAFPDQQPIMLRAELFRMDEGDAVSATTLYVSGETDVELSPGEADAFIAQAQAFVDTLRVLRRQMG